MMSELDGVDGFLTFASDAFDIRGAVDVTRGRGFTPAVAIVSPTRRRSLSVDVIDGCTIVTDMNCPADIILVGYRK